MKKNIELSIILRNPAEYKKDFIEKIQKILYSFNSEYELEVDKGMEFRLEVSSPIKEEDLDTIIDSLGGFDEIEGIEVTSYYYRDFLYELKNGLTTSYYPSYHEAIDNAHFSKASPTYPITITRYSEKDGNIMGVVILSLDGYDRYDDYRSFYKDIDSYLSTHEGVKREELIEDLRRSRIGEGESFFSIYKGFYTSLRNYFSQEIDRGECFYLSENASDEEEKKSFILIKNEFKKLTS